MLYNMFVHILSKPFDLHETRMGCVTNNSVGKEEFQKRKYLAGNFQ